MKFLVTFDKDSSHEQNGSDTSKDYVKGVP